MELILRGTQSELAVLMSYMSNGIIQASIAEAQQQIDDTQAEMDALRSDVPDENHEEQEIVLPVDMSPRNEVSEAEPATPPTAKKVAPVRRVKLKILAPGTVRRTVLDAIIANPGIDTVAITETTTLTQKQTQNAVSRLMAEGYLDRVAPPGAGKAASWAAVPKAEKMHRRKRTRVTAKAAVQNAEPAPVSEVAEVADEQEQVVTSTPAPEPSDVVSVKQSDEAAISLPAMILDVLRGQPGLKGSEITAVLNIPSNRVTAMLTHMRKAKSVRSEGAGGNSDPFLFFPVETASV